MNNTLSEPASTRPRRRRRFQDAQRLGLGKAFVRPAWGIGLGMLAALAIVLGMWLYHGNEDFRPSHEAASEVAGAEPLQAELTALTRQHTAVQTALGEAEIQLALQQASQSELLAQLAVADADKHQLKQDLAAFAEVLPTLGNVAVKIGGFQAGRTDNGQLRYRLLMMQVGKADADQAFVGELELLATDAQGKDAMMILPVDNQADALPARQPLEFSRYQRIEGVLDLPEGTMIKSLRARVLQKGRVRAEQSVHL